MPTRLSSVCPSGSLVGSGAPVASPPWWLFSGSRPCVVGPFGSGGWTNGSGPLLPSAMYATAMPIDSYHDARLVSYVAARLTLSPFFTGTRQLRFAAVIAMSHETGPAGSQYFATEWRIRT